MNGLQVMKQENNSRDLLCSLSGSTTLLPLLIADEVCSNYALKICLLGIHQCVLLGSVSGNNWNKVYPGRG